MDLAKKVGRQWLFESSLFLVFLISSVSYAASPGQVSLFSPSGIVLDSIQEFSWETDRNADWYRLYVTNNAGVVHDQWYKAADVISGSICMVTLDGLVDFDTYNWWVQTYGNSAGIGQWSERMRFTLSISDSPPESISLISPRGTASTPVTFTWNASSTATWYQLWVGDSNGNAVEKEWYSAQTVGCSSGEGTCSTTLGSVSFEDGQYNWWVQSWNGVGPGPWSEKMGFTVGEPGSALERAILIDPDASISPDETLSFSWNAVDTADWYYIWVTGDSGVLVKRWYTAAQAGCESGTGVCTVTPSVSLPVSGDCQWWIQTYNDYGYGDWSSAGSFTVETEDTASFYPLTQSNGEPIQWTYEINSGNPVESSLSGVELSFSFSDITISIDSQGTIKESSFTGTVKGDASGTIEVDVFDEFESGSLSKIKNQEIWMGIELSAYGDSLEVNFDLFTEFSPAAEWFLDRSDLDTLPIGYVYNEQGVVDAWVDGYLEVTGYGEEEIGPMQMTSAESWEILDKLSNMKVNGKTYTNIVKVKRTTIMPDFSGASAQSGEITYWVAKGVGMIKGIGQFDVLGNPLEIELVSTNIEQ